jgi:hypothetical protein
MTDSTESKGKPTKGEPRKATAPQAGGHADTSAGAQQTGSGVAPGQQSGSSTAQPSDRIITDWASI